MCLSLTVGPRHSVEVVAYAPATATDRPDQIASTAWLLQAKKKFKPVPKVIVSVVGDGETHEAADKRSSIKAGKSRRSFMKSKRGSMSADGGESVKVLSLRNTPQLYQ
jgi:hypothetical protein